MRQWIYWVLALVLAFTQLAGCQKRALFNPVLAGRFFPLRPGSSWTYQVAYASGARETLTDRVMAPARLFQQTSNALILPTRVNSRFIT
jgi:hypothetical protein